MAMLVKLTPEGGVGQYPYSENDLRSDHPDTSFPSDLTEADLSDFGAAVVKETDPGEPSEGKRFEQSPPVRQPDGTWKQAWVETDT